jgi:hypothetical protein
MENFKNTDYFCVYKFKINILFDHQDSKLLEQDLQAVDFNNYKRNFLYSFFNKNRIEVVDFIYNMNEGFNYIKSKINSDDFVLINKDIIIKLISPKNEKEIEIYRLKIKKILDVEIMPSKIDYGSTGRVFYKIKTVCEKI